MKRILSLCLSMLILFSSLIVLPVEAKTANLAKPTQFKVSVSDKVVKLSWKKVKNAKKYQVYRATSKNGKYKKIATTTKVKYTDKKAVTGKKYYYKVRAYRMNGKKKVYGKFSVVKKATLPKKPEPSPSPSSTPNNEFEPGAVLVGLNAPYLGESPLELFPELDIVEIEDLDKSTYDSFKDIPGADKDALEDIRKKIGTSYLIRLSSNTKESVWDAIEILKQNPLVEYAMPRYALKPLK